MYRWLQEDKVDLSFASRQDKGRYDWVPLWDDPLLAILPPGYPCQGKEGISGGGVRRPGVSHALPGL